MVLNWMNLLASVDNVVLRQDTRNCLITSISFHDCLQGSVELLEDGSGEESYLKFVEDLLLYMSLGKADIFCQVDLGAFLSTIIDKESTVVVSKA